MTLDAYMTGVAESIPKNAPESAFADPPKGLYVGDAHHAALAVQAVTSGLEGNVAKAKSKPGVKSKIESAIKEFYKGKLQQYYLTWLHSGTKPEERPAHEMVSVPLPSWSFNSVPDMPDIPPAPGVALDKLTKNDPEPFFITRPIAILGAVSVNGLLYDEFLLSEIQRQGVGKVARNGHISEANKRWQNPDSVGIWVGFLLVKNDLKYGADTLYGKCYVFPGTPFWAETKAKEAVGGELSNSIWTPTSLVVDNPDGTWRIVQLPLESIDFIPPERAALEALGGEFKTTSEMKQGVNEMADEHEAAGLALKESLAKMKPEDVHEMLHEAGQSHHVAEMHVKAHEMGTCKEGGIHEMLSTVQRKGVAESHVKESSPEETYAMLPAAHRKHVAEAYAKESGMKLVPDSDDTVQTKAIAEMKGAYDKRLSEMEKVVNYHQQLDYERTLDDAVNAQFASWVIRTEQGEKVLIEMKDLVRTQAVAEMAAMSGGIKKDNVAMAVPAAYAKRRSVIEMAKIGLTGGNAVIAPLSESQGSTNNMFGYDPKTGHYDSTQAQSARAQVNF